MAPCASALIAYGLSVTFMAHQPTTEKVQAGTGSPSCVTLPSLPCHHIAPHMLDISLMFGVYQVYGVLMVTVSNRIMHLTFHQCRWYKLIQDLCDLYLLKS